MYIGTNVLKNNVLRYLFVNSQILWLYIGCDLAGDGFCDDSTNDGTCQFDGGDCCLPEVKKDFCVFCHCYASQQYQERKLYYSYTYMYWNLDSYFFVFHFLKNAE